MKVIDIGKGHTIVAMITSVHKYGSRGMLRLRQEFDKKLRVVDVTGGEKVKTLILADDYLYLSSVTSETINKRIEST